ncbi:MAG: hypothetical protein SVR08_08960 [Spirochaetota bacterium]|nr:hypothetical protein [Spirochaetota bacterium]
MEEENKTDDVIEETDIDRKESLSPEEETLKLMVTEEASELLTNDNIHEIIKSFTADTEEKEIALEFVMSHVQFLREIIEHDISIGLSRSNIEIQDLISNVNSLLKTKNEYIFSSMIINCPAHYKSMKDYMVKEKDNVPEVVEEE